MASTRYRAFLRICQAWKVDSTKEGRDLAVHIRQRVAEAFPQGEVSYLQNTTDCDAALDSLSKIANNYHRDRYPRTFPSTVGATGADLADCKEMVSTKIQDYFSKQDKEN